MKLFYRIYQFGLWLFVLLFPFPQPKLFIGKLGQENWLARLKAKRNFHFLLVTDDNLVKLGIADQIEQVLIENNIAYTLFSNIQPNPTIENVEAGLILYNQHKCNGIICLGGGSVMDCAKLIGARVVKPNKSVKQLKGLFKILKKTPELYAIPTTAGTGSETTIVAVVTDSSSKQKYAVTDLCLTPNGAVLLPELTQNLPKHITATTGMDALTHAIESYIGINTTPLTKRKSLAAIKLIFENLELTATEGANLQARENMLLASFYAGEAFTRSSVGYVHAIAHQLGAIYDTPHGLANSVILPNVLRWYGDAIYIKLAEIANYCDLGTELTTPKQKAEMLIGKIEAMNMSMEIPKYLDAIEVSDIDKIARAALKEAHPDYPVPKIMNFLQCQQLVFSLLPRER